MKVEYQRTAKKSYMIVKNAEFPSPEYEEKMIRKNAIPCLLPFQTIRSDGKAEYWYDVSGRQSLKTVFSLDSLGTERLCFFLENLLEMKVAMEEYLLDDANICFLPETVWFDHEPERVRFCYIPGLGAASTAGREGSTLSGSEEAGLQHLFEEILQHLNHADPIAVRIGYEMYERCARGSFDMADCTDCLQIRETYAIQEAEQSDSEQDIHWGNEGAEWPEQAGEEENPEDVLLFSEGSGKQEGHRRKRKKDPMRDRPFSVERDREYFRETKRNAVRERARGTWRRWQQDDVETEEDALLFALREEPMEDFARTEVLTASAAAPTWQLVYKGNGLETDFELLSFPFLVGTDKSKVNGILLARTVSHVHAKFELQEGRLYVEDFNSTNGTYLNHTLLAMNTPTELTEGDRIVFATEEYEVFCRRAHDWRGVAQRRC